MYFTRTQQFLTTQTYLCSNKLICTTKYPHNVLFSNTYSFHNVGIPYQIHLKFYNSEFVNIQQWKMYGKTRGFVHYVS